MSFINEILGFFEGKLSQGASASSAKPILIGGQNHDGTAALAHVCSEPAAEAELGLSVRGVPSKTWRKGFSPATLDTTTDWQLICTGSNQTITHSAGSLVITTGTDVNAETIYRSRETWILRYRSQLSQRITNNNFFIELTDIISDAVGVSIAGTTTVTFTLTNHGYNTGQGFFVGNFVMSGGAVIVPGRYVIASTPTSDTFTMVIAGSTGTGTGTCSAWGYNYSQIAYYGTSATTHYFDAQRNGYASGYTSATQTTSATGHVVAMQCDDGLINVAEGAQNSTSSPTMRFARNVNIPDNGIDLYVQIRVQNGSTAPATTTSFTIGFIQMEDFAGMPVTVFGGKGIAGNQACPTTISGTVSVGGTTAHDGAVSGSPVRIAGRALTSNYTAVATGDVADLTTWITGQLVTAPYSIPDLHWQYATPSGAPITDTVDVAIKATAGAGIRNYITGIQIFNSHATVGTVVVIKDGATTIWTGYVPPNLAAAPNSPVIISFNVPLRGTANTAFNFACITTGTNTYVSAQGFVSAA